MISLRSIRRQHLNQVEVLQNILLKVGFITNCFNEINIQIHEKLIVLSACVPILGLYGADARRAQRWYFIGEIVSGCISTTVDTIVWKFVRSST